VQQLHEAGASPEAMHQQQINLERLCEVPRRVRELREGPVRLLARGTQTIDLDPRFGGGGDEEAPGFQFRPEKTHLFNERDQDGPRRRLKAKKRSPKIKEEQMIWWNCRGGVRSNIEIVQHYCTSVNPVFIGTYFILRKNVQTLLLY